MIFGCLQCYNCIAFRRPAEVTALQVLLTALLRGWGTHRFSSRKGAIFPLTVLPVFRLPAGLILPGLNVKTCQLHSHCKYYCESQKIFLRYLYLKKASQLAGRLHPLRRRLTKTICGLNSAALTLRLNVLFAASKATPQS